MTATDTIGVLICGHGSREAETAREFDTLVRKIAARLASFQVESGALEFATPSIRDGLQKLVQHGRTQIIAVPGTLLRGGHSSRDIPAILREFSARFPGINIRYGRELGADAKLINTAIIRVREAIAVAQDDLAAQKTALLVAGRGAADPSTNAIVETVMRAVQTELNFTHGATAFAGIATPLIEPALRHIAQQEYQRIIVLPYLLFNGVLVNKIYQQVDDMVARYPDVQFIKAGYLNSHPLVVECFVDRIMECLQPGTPIHG